MELLAIVVGLVLVGVAAARYGRETRDLDATGTWHTWREDALRRGLAGPGPVMADPLGVGLETALRVGELRADASRQLCQGPASPTSRLSCP